MRKWFPAILVACAFAVSVAVYPQLPARVPIHWDIHGHANGYGSRAVAAFLTPAIMLGIALLIPVLPKIDPRQRNYEKFGPTYDVIFATILVVVLGIHLAALGTALGVAVPIARIVPGGLGVLFIVLGNVLPRVRPNWMVGIRTPWTLSSDRVWERTHRVGGYLLAAAGVVLLVTTFFPAGASGITIGIAAVLLAVLGAVAYSYVAWRQEKHS